MMRVSASVVVIVMMISAFPARAQGGNVMWPMPELCTQNDLKDMLDAVAPITAILDQVSAASVETTDDRTAAALLLDQARLMFNNADIPFCADGVVLVGLLNRVIYSSELSLLYAAVETDSASVQYQTTVMQSANDAFRILMDGYADLYVRNEWLTACTDHEYSNGNWAAASDQMVTYVDLIPDIQDFLDGEPLSEDMIASVEHILEEFDAYTVNVPQCNDITIEIIADESMLYDTLLTLTMSQLLQERLAAGADPALTGRLSDAVDDLKNYLSNSICYWTGDPMCTPS